jgi:LmbE family N-acetylglucosaminyl deacetylase
MATGVFFHAHPDDEAIATGGTMAKAKADGHRVILVLATKGELGTPVPGVLEEGEELWVRREAETLRSAEILGADRVEFLGFRDSGMIGEDTNDDPRAFWQADVDAVAERLADLLREEDADVLVVYDDHGGYGHPDHIQVHRVGVEAARRAGTPQVFESTMNRDALLRGIDELSAEAADGDADELEDTRRELRAGTFGSPESIITHAVDVRGFVEHKRAAMLAHASQIAEESFFLKMPDDAFVRTFGTEWFIERGRDRDGGPFDPAVFT